MPKQLVILALAALGLNIFSARGADSTNSDVSLRIFSARVSHGGPDFNKRFPGRYSYGEDTPGVNMQFLLTLKDGTVLAVPRDGLSLDTFVDDTYQSLLGTGNDSRYNNNNGQSFIGEDGHAVLFTVATSHPPADDAGRVFVRGTLDAKIGRGEPLVATNQLSLTVGQEVTVGPFRSVLRSVSDQGAGNLLNLSFSVEGDASRIKKARILDGNGKVLSEDRQFRFELMQPGDRPITAYVLIKSPPKDAPVFIEFTYFEKVETVQIPFEAQVDIGVAKAGPIEPGERKPSKRNGAKAWPPPRENPDNTMPPRRATFDPASKSAKQSAANSLKLDKASVDLFSLTLGKPAPSEVKSVVWKNPPSSSFFATGFTIARLMLSVPGGSILSVPSDGVVISSFKDDKGGKLDTTCYRDNYSPYTALSTTRLSPDGQQTLVNVSLASAPTPGATRCTLAGEVKAQVARDQSTNTSAALPLHKGQEFPAGPFTVTINELRQAAMSTPASQDSGELDIWLTISGPADRIQSLELLDDKGRPLGMSRADFTTFGFQRDSGSSRSFRLVATPPGPVSVRIRHFGSEETVRVPFEVTTGVGL